VDPEKIKSLWKALLEEIGDDPTRGGLINTPNRIAKAYVELFSGYHTLPPKITTFDEQCEGMVIDRGYFFSFCEHHVLPFFGNYYFGYIPRDRQIIGASKIGRTIDHFSARLQVAERICCQVIDYIANNSNSRGMILLMTGRHLCKEMRGIKKHNSSFEACEARGCFLTNKNNCKDEFFARIGAKL
jgi:GTP cyclohydrolase I